MIQLRNNKCELLYNLKLNNKNRLYFERIKKGNKASILADTMFKAIFQNENRMKYSCKLISYFVDINYEELLKKIKLVKSELNMEDIKVKNERCDYVAEVDDSLINIEVNNNNSLMTMERNLEYAYRLYLSKVVKGKEYNYTQTIQININNFAFQGNEKIIDTYYLQNEEGIKLTDKVIIVNIYVPKLREKMYNLGIGSLDEKERYLLTLIEQEIKLSKELSKGDKIMEEYVDEAEKVSYERGFGESYDKLYALEEQAKRDGYEEGKEKGYKEGEKKSISKIALSMMKKNIDIDTINECTGLSKEEIMSLK